MDETCDRSCLQRDDKGRALPRRYPIERVCCAVAYLATLPDTAHRSVALKVIAARVSAEHARTVQARFRQAVLAARGSCELTRPAKRDRVE